MAVTLKDIATAAGVSIGTVDRAMNSRGRISPETAKRVKKIAKDLGYKTNVFASSLAKKTRHYVIAIILHITKNDFFDDALAGIAKAEQEFHDYGISIKVYPCKNFDAHAQLENINLALNNGADALVIVPINHPIIEEKVKQLHNANFPIVYLISYLPNVPSLSFISCDHWRSGRIAGRISEFFKNDTQLIAFFPSSLMIGNDIRKKGLTEHFSSNSSSLKLKQIVELTNDYNTDYNIIYNTLSGNKSVNCVLFSGDAKVVLDALAQINRPIKSICFDLSVEIEAALLDGRISATIIQSTKEEGYQSIYVLAQYLLSGIIPEKRILTDTQIIIKECIDSKLK